MCFCSLGLSPSQRIAVWSARVARWRSMQFAETLSVPSSNQRIETSPVKLVSLTLVYGLIQSSRLPCSRQNPSGSRTDAAYRRSYPASSIQARSFAEAGGGKRLLLDMTFSLPTGVGSRCGPRSVRSSGDGALVRIIDEGGRETSVGGAKTRTGPPVA